MPRVSDVFSEEDLRAFLEVAREALQDAETFDRARSALGLSDDEMIDFRNKLQNFLTPPE